jgi:hypothetical protein
MAPTRFVTPFSVVIANLPITYDDQGKAISTSLTWLRQLLVNSGYRVQKVVPAWNEVGFWGHAIIQFSGRDFQPFASARKLEKVFKLANRGREDYCFAFGDKIGPYVWLATERHVQTDFRFRYIHDLTPLPMGWEEYDPPTGVNDQMVVQWIMNHLAV